MLKFCTCGEHGRYFVCVSTNFDSSFRQIAEHRILAEVVSTICECLMRGEVDIDITPTLEDTNCGCLSSKRKAIYKYLECKEFINAMKKQEIS